MSTLISYSYKDILLLPEVISRAIDELVRNAISDGEPDSVVEIYRKAYNDFVNEGKAIINQYFPTVPTKDRCETKPPPCPWPKGVNMHNIKLSEFTPILVLRTDLNSYEIYVTEDPANGGSNKELFRYKVKHNGLQFAEYAIDSNSLSQITVPQKCILYIECLSQVNPAVIYKYHFELN